MKVEKHIQVLFEGWEQYSRSLLLNASFVKLELTTIFNIFQAMVPWTFRLTLPFSTITGYANSAATIALKQPPQWTQLRFVTRNGWLNQWGTVTTHLKLVANCTIYLLRLSECSPVSWSCLTEKHRDNVIWISVAIRKVTSTKYVLRATFRFDSIIVYIFLYHA